MATFYDNWLGMWDQAVQERQRARKCIHEEEIEWVQTQQDAKIGLLAAPETGFRTWGSVTMVAEIPVGWHTGKHKHGEEAIHIVQGSGFSIVNERRYNWKQNSTLVIPFGAVHQHFNTGNTPVRYFAAMSVHLEHFVGLHRTTQYEVCGPTKEVPEVPLSANGFDDRNRRIVLQIEEAPVQTLDKERDLEMVPDIDPNRPLVVGTLEGWQAAIPAGMHREVNIPLMRLGTDMHGFQVYEQEIGHLMSDPPHDIGGTHAHMEAHIYVLQGTGHTLVDGEKVPWRKGTCLHVPGPQTIHQHVNEGDEPSQMLRVYAGIRRFFEAMAKEEFPYLAYGVRPALLREKRERERERQR